MSDELSNADYALEMLRAGRAWVQGGCDYRDRQYSGGAEEIWFEDGGFVYRAWTAAGYASGGPNDLHESVERWDEARVRAHLAGTPRTYWAHAPRGPLRPPAWFAPDAPMPGFVARPLPPVTEADLDRVVDHLRRGRAFSFEGRATHGGATIVGLETIGRGGTAQHSYRQRYWYDGGSPPGDVRGRWEGWTEGELRAFLATRPDVVHWAGWPAE